MSTDAPVAIVTGAAGGLGSAICKGLAEQGFRVVVGFNRSAEGAAVLAAGLAGLGHCALEACVTDSRGLTALAVEIRRRYGRCDVLVNCAGTTRFVEHANLEGLNDELIDDILRTNVRGCFAAIRALVPLLRESPRKGGGVVVNISSVAARTAMGSNVIYCASKAALDNLTVSLARALAPQIRVVSVAPGLVDTAFVAALDPGWRNEQAARTPMGRLARPDEIAQGVISVVRDLTFTTGCVIAIDGGRPSM